MKIEKLRLEGGVRVSGSFPSGEPYQIERISSAGETRFSFPGMDVDYDTDGQLIYVAIRMVEFAVSHPAEYVMKLPIEFHEAVAMMTKGGVEIMAECDFLTGQANIVKIENSNRTVLSQYDMSFYDSTLISVRLTDADGEVGSVGFLVEKRDDGMMKLGVGALGVSSCVIQPMKVDLGLLSEEIDQTTITRLLKGIPPEMV